MSSSSDLSSTCSHSELVTDVTQESASCQTPSADELTKTGTLTLYLLFSVLVITFGSHFQFGFAIGSINAPAEHIKGMINLSHHSLSGSYMDESSMDIAWGTAASIVPFGALLGALVAGYCADSYGRRRTLHVNNALAIAAAAAMTSAKFIGSTGFYPLFHFGRLLVGINSGIASSVAPLYVTELSPIRVRGAIGSVPRVMATLAILVSEVVGLPELLGNETRWPFIFTVGLMPAAIHIVFLFFVPESPKYTLSCRGNRHLAFADLARLRGSEGGDTTDIEAELDLLQSETDKDGKRIGFRHLFAQKLRWRTTVTCFLMMGQQFSGFSAIMFYSTDVFHNSVFRDSHENAVYATVAIGAVNVITTCVSMRLVEHPRLGRRSLLLFGNAGMLVSMVLLSISLIIMNNVPEVRTAFGYVAVVFVALFVISFASGPGSIPMFYVSEIFATDARASAAALSVAVNRSCAFTIGLSFPSMQTAIGEYTFFVFAGFLAMSIAFVVYYVPETKAKHLKEIVEELEARKPLCC
ncbi:Protein FGT-1 a [Aphelenchoides avenae]|nr:Protein FGT-1 a [Aphelenchus avenae]